MAMSYLDFDWFSSSELYEIYTDFKNYIQPVQTKQLLLFGLIGVNLCMATGLNSGCSAPPLKWDLELANMTYFKSIGLTMQPPRLLPLANAWSVILYKITNALALLQCIFPANTNANLVLPLLAGHVLVLTTVIENVIGSSFEIVRLAEHPTRQLIAFSCFSWTLLSINIVLLCGTLKYYKSDVQIKHDHSNRYLLQTDDEVFAHFPTNLKEKRFLDWFESNTETARTLCDINRMLGPMYTKSECENSLASIHRDLMSSV